MVVKAYAKVNLTLEVFGKRADGYHALRSVVLPIGLCDTLTFTPADAFSTDTGYADDLILKAASALVRAQSLDASRPPFAIQVEKRIPAGGGLGGGSADAAATLLALNDLWGLGKTPEALAEIGARVGSDVPALVLANHYRRPVLMQGRGEDVALVPLRNAKKLHLVLANPHVSCSTAAVYGKYSMLPTTERKIASDRMCAALESNDMNDIVAAMMNDLQEPAISVCPEIKVTLAALREAGVAGAMLSGSGSTVFGLVSTEGEGRRIVNELKERGVCAWSVDAI